jgi:hypothetical protein
MQSALVQPNFGLSPRTNPVIFGASFKELLYSFKSKGAGVGAELLESVDGELHAVLHAMQSAVARAQKLPLAVTLRVVRHGKTDSTLRISLRWVDRRNQKDIPDEDVLQEFENVTPKIIYFDQCMHLWRETIMLNALHSTMRHCRLDMGKMLMRTNTALGAVQYLRGLNANVGEHAL